MRKICSAKKSIERSMNESVLGLYGHVGRIAEERFVKKIYNSTVKSTVMRGRPWKR